MKPAEVPRSPGDDLFLALRATDSEVAERAQRDAELLQINPQIVQRRIRRQRAREHLVRAIDPPTRAPSHLLANDNGFGFHIGGKPRSQFAEPARRHLRDVLEQIPFIERALLFDFSLQAARLTFAPEKLRCNLHVDIKITHPPRAPAELSKNDPQFLGCALVELASQHIEHHARGAARTPQHVHLFRRRLACSQQFLRRLEHLAHGTPRYPHGLDTLRATTRAFDDGGQHAAWHLCKRPGSASLPSGFHGRAYRRHCVAAA